MIHPVQAAKPRSIDLLDKWVAESSDCEVGIQSARSNEYKQRKQWF